ncbi:hypothetical protein TWF173_000063 [Orbilia oligospora]|uniref:DUF1993 domain-containing protein n=1 Tax=Arthrobotrys oligospora (strain ATCC 24927 / CBS 115.81 / DSM 1491) TaxID=756982 RepID=G1XIX4_ARTOA|nr:hypothetical protein AOL_s00097g301 [Orbilia oligospora ATCC 24927]EGX46875.1 hypothetical protein AOL_s00097g301 [Orbilia oligospora ATCC 24927]KAF3319434.1 hypothetical protein TWF173_000063 [Orbilia oligospora]
MASSLTLFDVTVPLFRKGMKTLKHILEKGEAYAKENGISTNDVVNWKLAEDMKPLTFQIQTASNTAKNTCVRVAKLELAVLDDNEETLEDLYKRIDTTLALLDEVEAKHKAAFEGKEDSEVVLVTRGTERKFTGQSYVQTFAIPNFYFHVTTAYNILRNHGVPIGKLDYLLG